MMYRPMKFLGTVGAILLTFGILLGVRFLVVGAEGHVQSLILAAIFTIVGAQTIFMGLHADLISANRRMIEDIQYRVRKMEAGDALIAPYYAGDALTMLENNDSLDFVIPKSGTNLFVDAMCIPSTARQKEAAEMYINFMCEPDIAFANIDDICYSTPHSAAYEMLDEETRESPVCYPDEDFIENKTTVFVSLSAEANRKMQDLWTEMKSSEDENTNKWITPVFLIVCIALTVFVLIHRKIKEKKDIF
jgi:hypothetical protein